MVMVMFNLFRVYNQKSKSVREIDKTCFGFKSVIMLELSGINAIVLGVDMIISACWFKTDNSVLST